MKKTINKRLVETLPFAASGTDYFLDAKLAGFGLRIGKTKKVFIVEKRVRGKTVRVKIGEFPLVTVEDARKRAQEVLAQMSEGINPNKTRPGSALKNLTLAHALKDYLASRSLKPRTVEDVKRSFNTKLKGWLERPIHGITRDDVLQHHAKMEKENGAAQANLTMRYLRSVLNFAKPRYKLANGAPLLKENPVLVLTETRSWKRVPRRQTVIQRKDLGTWFRTVLEIREANPREVSGTICDYLLVLMLTGLRRGEATGLKWEQVDLEAGVLTISDTKNHEPHRLPLSDFLWDLFRERHRHKINEYVFQGREGGSGHIVTPQKTMNQVTEKCGVKFCSHDLRRTFTSIAEALGITSYTIKRLLNHKITSEITGGYIVRGYDQDRLREPVQQITDFILGEAAIERDSQEYPVGSEPYPFESVGNNFIGKQ